MFAALKWLKTSTENFIEYGLQFYMKLTSIDVNGLVKHIAYKKTILGMRVCLAGESNLSITVCSWLSFFKQVRSLMV